MGVRSPLAHHLDECSNEAVVESSFAPPLGNERAPAGVVPHAQGATLLHTKLVLQLLATDLLARLDHDVATSDVPLRLGDQGFVEDDGVLHSRAVVANPTIRRRRVVQHRRKEHHAASGRLGVLTHLLLFATAVGGDVGDTLRRVRPGLQRALVGQPGEPSQHAIDRQLLEHQFEIAALHVDLLEDATQRQWARGKIEDGQHLVDVLLVGKRCRDEPVLDVAVLDAAQQHPGRRAELSPGPPDLLVVTDGRPRPLEVHDEGEVGLVVPHAQRSGGDQRLDLVALQGGLGIEPQVCIRATGVGQHVVTVPAQPGRNELDVADGQAVDDACPGQRRQHLVEPGEPLGRRRHVDHLQRQPVAGKGTTKDRMPAPN